MKKPNKVLKYRDFINMSYGTYKEHYRKLYPHERESDEFMLDHYISRLDFWEQKLLATFQAKQCAIEAVKSEEKLRAEREENFIKELKALPEYQAKQRFLDNAKDSMPGLWGYLEFIKIDVTDDVIELCKKHYQWLGVNRLNQILIDLCWDVEPYTVKKWIVT